MEPNKKREINTDLTKLPRIISRAIFYILISSLLLISPSIFAQELKTIAITQIVDHPSLEKAKQGILDTLQENGFILGKNLNIIEQNAQGSITTATMIAKKFAGLKPDAIVPISTPSAQTVLMATKGMNIPVVFSSVTDPVSAGLVTDVEVANERVTGAIDFPPLKEELELIKELIPNIKTLGVLYNSGEANSVKTLGLLKQTIGYDIKIIESVAHSSNEAPSAFKKLVGEVDAVYAPSDNTIFASIPKLVQISRQEKLPIFSSDPDSVKQGFLACVGYSQYEIGRTAGRLLVKVLNRQKNIKIEKPSKVDILINQATADKIGIEVPEQLKTKME